MIQFYISKPIYFRTVCAIFYHEWITTVFVEQPRALPGSGTCAPLESLISLGTYRGNFFQTIHLDFPLFIRLLASKPKKMQARVAPWACLDKHWIPTCTSLTVLNTVFGGWRKKSGTKSRKSEGEFAPVPLGKVWLPSGPPVGKFSRQFLRTFHC